MSIRITAFILVLGIAASLLGACGGGTTDSGATAGVSQIELGSRVYVTRCLTCHQQNGQGVSNMYPTLHQTEWTEGDKGRLIRLLLHGVQGPMEVKGTVYNNVMPAHGYLSDDQIAAVLTYIRSHFDNDASSVAPAEVAAVRKASTHEGLWTADALWEATGIPGADSSADASAADTAAVPATP